MKGARSTLILLVTFLGLAAYVYFVEWERPPASEAPPKAQLFEFEADDINALTISTGNEETMLHRTTDDAWELTDPIQGTADTTVVSAIITEISTLEIHRVVQEESVDLIPFGLSPPIVKVSFAVENNETNYQLLIGETTPTGITRYAKLAQDNRIVLVPASVESVLNKSTFELRDKKILNIPSTDVDKLEINHNDSTVQFLKSDNEWRLIKPWNVRADFNTVESLIGLVSNGQMLSVATENINIDEEDGETKDDTITYGLSAPLLTATLQSGSDTATLRVGSTAPRGEQYAQDASRSMVFTIENSLVTALKREPLEYRRKDLFSFRSFNATRLEIERPGTTVIFNKSDDTDESIEATWNQTEPEDRNIKRSDIDDLLSKISNIRASAFITSRSDLSLSDSDVIATVRVHFGDKDNMESVVFWRSGEDTYAVHGNEPGVGIVDSESIDEAFDAIPANSEQTPEE